MSRTTPEAPSHFPHWVALGSLAFVLWLFFGNTVPALRESQELRAHAEELKSLKASYDAAIQEARLGVGPNAHYDLQALLVAIDQRGYTPLELCVAYPDSRSAGTGPDDQPAHDRTAR
jgi:hypothetical protein